MTEPQSSQTNEPVRISRREVLKRGAVLGGSVLWVTPVVQTVGMGTAFAQTPSPRCSIYCVVWSQPTAASPNPDGWAPDDGGGCLPCPPDSEGDLPPDIGDFTVSYNQGTLTYTVTYPNTYELVPAGDPTPDELVDGSASIRLSDDLNSCQFVKAADQMPGLMPGTTQIQFTNWVRGNDRIELVIKHCI